MLYITFNSQTYLCMEITRIRTEQGPFLDLQQEDEPVCQVDIESRRQSPAINKTVPVCHCRPVRKQGGSPVDCLETAQSGKPDTETDIPALVRQYRNKVAEFPRELRFGYRFIFVGVLLYLIIKTIQPLGTVTVGMCKGQRGEVVAFATTLP